MKKNKTTRAAPRPAAAEPEQFLPFRVHRLAARLGFSEEYKTKSGVRIKVREWRVLFLLRAMEGLSNADICAFLDMDPATASRAVKALAGQGLVALASAPEDGRKLISRLTPRGHGVYDEIAPSRIGFAREIEACLSAAERVALYAILDKLDRQCALAAAAEKPARAAP